ncbi:uncharacterized protein G2W53_000976 [Senna tora]|uniref:Uncharacterized protein n=1 Tax=Senna tora TaxID=362788 RepID=A0A834XHK6_9FABA|nr:uncharacterized protein G2W53_000976 [Senna tora]
MPCYLDLKFRCPSALPIPSVSMTRSLDLRFQGGLSVLPIPGVSLPRSLDLRIQVSQCPTNPGGVDAPFLGFKNSGVPCFFNQSRFYEKWVPLLHGGHEDELRETGPNRIKKVFPECFPFERVPNWPIPDHAMVHWSTSSLATNRTSLLKEGFGIDNLDSPIDSDGLP